MRFSPLAQQSLAKTYGIVICAKNNGSGVNLFIYCNSTTSYNELITELENLLWSVRGTLKYTSRELSIVERINSAGNIIYKEPNPTFDREIKKLNIDPDEEEKVFDTTDRAENFDISTYLSTILEQVE